MIYIKQIRHFVCQSSHMLRIHVRNFWPWFTRSEVYKGKRIARARIHVERVMGRLKEFRLLKNILPLTMIDLCDQIWIIAGAIVNMQPPLIK